MPKISIYDYGVSLAEKGLPETYDKMKEKTKPIVKFTNIQKVSGYVTNEETKEFELKAVVKNEIDVLKNIQSNENVKYLMPKYYGSYVFNEKIYVMTEFIEGHTLYELLLLDHADVHYDPIILCGKLINMIINLHKNNIFHKDIKTQNIMVGNDNKIYFIDFGLSCINNIKLGFCGFKVLTSDRSYDDINNDIENMKKVIKNILDVNKIPHDSNFILNKYLTSDFDYWKSNILMINEKYVDICSNLIKKSERGDNVENKELYKKLWNEALRINKIPSFFNEDGKKLIHGSLDLCNTLMSNKLNIIMPTASPSTTEGEYDELIKSYSSYYPSTATLKRNLNVTSTQKLKIVALSLFRPAIVSDGGNKYYNGLKLFINHFSSTFDIRNGWILRIYYDDSLNSTITVDGTTVVREPRWMKLLNDSKQLKYVQLVKIKMPDLFKDGFHMGFLPTLFRFIAMKDIDAQIVCFRDIDSAPLKRDLIEMNKFIASSNYIHKYDLYTYNAKHLKCFTEIFPHLNVQSIDCFLGGLFSVKPCKETSAILYHIFNSIRNDNELLINCLNVDITREESGQIKLLTYGTDEVILNYAIYKNITDKTLIVHKELFFIRNIMSYLLYFGKLIGKFDSCKRNITDTDYDVYMQYVESILNYSKQNTQIIKTSDNKKISEILDYFLTTQKEKKKKMDELREIKERKLKTFDERSSLLLYNQIDDFFIEIIYRLEAIEKVNSTTDYDNVIKLLNGRLQKIDEYKLNMKGQFDYINIKFSEIEGDKYDGILCKINLMLFGRYRTDPTYLSQLNDPRETNNYVNTTFVQEISNIFQEVNIYIADEFLPENV